MSSVERSSSFRKQKPAYDSESDFETDAKPRFSLARLLVGFLAVAGATLLGMLITGFLSLNLPNSKKPNNSDIKLNKAGRFLSSDGSLYNGKNILLLFGAPGSGKGTHGPLLEKHLDLPIIIAGDCFRNLPKATPLHDKFMEISKTGALMPDDVAVEIVMNRLKRDDCTNGFILDGFPRTVNQAKILDEKLKGDGDKVVRLVEFHVNDYQKTIKPRVCSRWGGYSSTYPAHMPESYLKAREIERERFLSKLTNKFRKPTEQKIEEHLLKVVLPKGGECSDEKMINMQDNQTGAPLKQRADDTPDSFDKRIETYKRETEPILEYYSQRGEEGPKSYRIEIDDPVTMRARQVGEIQNEIKDVILDSKREF